jgi:hypothetical protein
MEEHTVYKEWLVNGEGIEPVGSRRGRCGGTSKTYRNFKVGFK